jgi:hypothetical protein
MARRTLSIEISLANGYSLFRLVQSIPEVGAVSFLWTKIVLWFLWEIRLAKAANLQQDLL